MNNQKQKYLGIAIRSFLFINLWPEDNKKSVGIKQYYAVSMVVISIISIFVDFIIQVYDEEFLFTTLNENLVAMSALCGPIYIFVCYMRKRHEIKTLINDLCLFEKFTPAAKITETENAINFYTKFFLIYGVLGSICYGIMPAFNYKNCNENRSQHMVKYGIPCGLMIRYVLPFRYDSVPFAEIIIIEQIIAGGLATIITVVATMLVCGVLIHICTHLKHLRVQILELSSTREALLLNHVRFCLRFHTTILNYAARANKTFDQMMLLHITLTGFVISVIGFEIVMLDNFVEISRFVLHLLGWLVLLYIVCHYGQVLMDESTAISYAIYSMKWYDKPIAVQKCVTLMLLRSQKPLTLTAAGLKVMSLATFLGVLYSAYSYFTLLLKLKP